MIFFEKLRWKNFLATGNEFTEMQLDRSPTTLIIGKNGAGKTTFLDSLYYVLYGATFRKINLPLLVNTITNKNMLVEVEFRANGKHYKVRRGQKPAIFEIYENGEMWNQSDTTRDYQNRFVKEVLKMTPQTFKQVVVLGSTNYKPFMSLSKQERRDTIEDLLDIKIISTMNSILSNWNKENKAAILDTTRDIDSYKDRIEILKKSIKTMSENNDHQIAQIELNKRKEEDAIEIEKKEYEELLEQYSNIVLEDVSKYETRRSEINRFEGTAETKIGQYITESNFLSDNEDCPVCKQEITEEFRTSRTSENEQKCRKVEKLLIGAKEEANKIDIILKTAKEARDQRRSLRERMEAVKATIRMRQQQISRYNQEIEENKQRNKDDSLSDNLVILKNKLKALEGEYSDLLETKNHIAISSIMLKDSGIKAKIVNRYLPIINEMINKYLRAFNFLIEFNLDNEFSETIHSRYRDKFVYESFSEGEKARIDLSLMFAWRELAKMKNNASTNLLIMDEVFGGSNDDEADAELLNIINELTADTNTFIISHKVDQFFDSFRSVIQFEKVKNFSHMVKA